MTHRFDHLKRMLPSFPRTPHIPCNPNMEDGDVIAENVDFLYERQEAEHGMFTQVHIEEKIDGASVGMTIHEGHPVIRNRDHILSKGYLKDTPAKKQFVPIWNWWYDRRKQFEALSECPYSIYGEWMVAQHGIHYDRLPDWFIAYDVYNYEEGLFIAPDTARQILMDLGFSVPPVLHGGGLDEYQLENYVKESSAYYNGPVEGIYIKVATKEFVTHRFKMVRPDFVRGRFWDGKTLLKNDLLKPDTYIVPPANRRVTPKCCEAVQNKQAVFLLTSDSFTDGDNDTPPKWSIACKNEEHPEFDSFGEVDCCPFCGTALPEVVKVSIGEYKICTCIDGGYYCNTCEDRLGGCQCLPPTHQWGSK